MPGVPLALLTTRVIAAGAMPTVSAVHEEVQERAGEEKEIGHYTQEMRPVFRQKKEGPDREKPQQDPPALHERSRLLASNSSLPISPLA